MGACSTQSVWDEKWDLVKGKLHSLLQGSQLSLNERSSLRQSIFELCEASDNSFDLVYDKYKNFLQSYIDSEVLPSSIVAEFSLTKAVEDFEDFNVKMCLIHVFFRHLDKHIKATSILSIEEMALQCYRERVFNNIKDPAKECILRMIREERAGNKIDKWLLFSASDMFMQLNVGNLQIFDDDFQKDVIADVATFYYGKACEWIKDTFPTYLCKAEDSLNKEKDIVSHYLHLSLEEPVLETVRNIFLAESTSCFEDNSCFEDTSWLEDDENVSRCVRHLSKDIPTLKLFVDFYMQFLSEKYIEAQDTEDDFSNGVGLLKKLVKCVTSCSLNHVEYNEVTFNIPEVLVSFCDQTLMAKREDTIAETFETLNEIVNLLACIKDKDYFSKLYRLQLGNRLLFGKANLENERLFLTRLSTAMWEVYSAKMLTMVTDYEDAEKFNFLYNEKLPVDVVRFQSYWQWPGREPLGLRSPLDPRLHYSCAEMGKAAEFMADMRAPRSRRLVGEPDMCLGEVLMDVSFDGRVIELQLIPYQAAVLYLFDDNDCLSYEDIKSKLNLADHLLKRALESLSCADYDILIKIPKADAAASETDLYEFNSSFIHDKDHLKVPMPAKYERELVLEACGMDREIVLAYWIDAAMNVEKTQSFRSLVEECTTRVSLFKPTDEDVQKGIDYLVHKEFIKRDAEDMDLYHLNEET